MIQPKFNLLPKETQLKILTDAGKNGIGVTAKQYHQSVDMTERSLYNAIQKRIAPKQKTEKTVHNGGGKSSQKGNGERKLTQKEKSLVKRIRSGEITLDEAAQIVAATAFENLLRNPGDIRMIDFFRTELLKLKKEENQIKDTWGKEIIARFFAGKLPPKYCPHCGKPTVDTVVLEGEVAHDRLIESSDDN